MNILTSQTGAYLQLHCCLPSSLETKKPISPTMRILIPSTFLMIVVTGVLYNILIAPSNPATGLFIYTSFAEHTFIPIFALAVWAAAGPNVMAYRNLPKYFIVPVLYSIYTAILGAIRNEYPYDFFNATTKGYTSFVVTTLEIIAFGVVIMLLMIPIDRALVERRR